MSGLADLYTTLDRLSNAAASHPAVRTTKPLRLRSLRSDSPNSLIFCEWETTDDSTLLISQTMNRTDTVRGTVQTFVYRLC